MRLCYLQNILIYYPSGKYKLIVMFIISFPFDPFGITFQVACIRLKIRFPEVFLRG